MNELQAFYVVMIIFGFLCLMMTYLGIYQTSINQQNKSNIEGLDFCPLCNGKGYRYGWKIYVKNYPEQSKIYKKVKCIACNGSGYRGFTDNILVPLKYEIDRNTLDFKYKLCKKEEDFIQEEW